MSEALEWARLAVDLAVAVIPAVMLAIFATVALRVVRAWKQQQNPTLAVEGGLTLRAIFCRHSHVCRVRSGRGRWYTACTRCGSDVNMGKPREAWR